MFARRQAGKASRCRAGGERGIIERALKADSVLLVSVKVAVVARVRTGGPPETAAAGAMVSTVKWTLGAVACVAGLVDGRTLQA